jgi:hypothetical protein
VPNFFYSFTFSTSGFFFLVGFESSAAAKEVEVREKNKKKEELTF